MTLSYIAVLIITALIFLFLLILLAFQPKVIARLNGIFIAFSATAGIVLYGYGYIAIYESIPNSIIHTLFAVIKMFLGSSSIDELASIPLFQSDGMITFFYLIHMLATYSAVSAVISVLGQRLLRRMNLLLIQRGTLHLIYGTSWDAVDFGLRLQKLKGNVTVFLDTGNGAYYDEEILRAGSLLIADENVYEPSAALLKRLGIKPGRRKIALYCLEDHPRNNHRFAEKMMHTLASAGIRPEQVSVSLFTDDESKGMHLQAQQNGTVGYGSVYAIERENILARAMIKLVPPYRTMTFNEAGLAQNDFHMLIAGFGQTGQAVLRNMLMNSRFAGSSFHASVIDLDHLGRSGYFLNNYPEIVKQYDVHFYDTDACSVDAYAIVKEQSSQLNYVVICTGDTAKNEEIARGYSEILSKNGCAAPIMVMHGNGVSRYGYGNEAFENNLFSMELLCLDKLDAMAMMLNHKYHEQEGNSVAEDWRQCDYFSRRSCRASADFVDAFLYSVGMDRQDVLDGRWSLSREQLENLSISEHERWCAFHYAMGYQKMPDEVYDSRAEIYQKQVAEGMHPLRIGKDTEKKLHACLIPWEELDALAEKESAITGKAIDYKQLDADNVELIPELITKTAALK